MALSSRFFHTNRTKALDNLAYEMNYDFQKRNKYDFFRLLQEFELCKTHRLKKARNIISKTDPWKEEEIFIFDYARASFWPCHWLSHPKDQHTVFFVSSKYLELPELLIKPKTNPSQWDIFKRDEIRFEDYPEFDRKYYVRGNNEVFVKKMVNRFLIHYLTYMEGWTIESLNFLLVIYKQGHLVPPTEIKEFMESCMEIYHRLKVPIK